MHSFKAFQTTQKYHSFIPAEIVSPFRRCGAYQKGKFVTRSITPPLATCLFVLQAERRIHIVSICASIPTCEKIFVG